MNKAQERGLYLLLISVHGLLRGHDLELGRDADTGGQIQYVVEFARALAAHPEVERVDVLTRQIQDPKISADYANPLEELCPKAYIVRLPCGPQRYLRKEVLWPYLDSFVDRALQHVRSLKRVPDIIHGHYADAGYVGSRLAGLLGAPFVFTGHSLGYVKRQRLREAGVKESTIESSYRIGTRIEAEETALDSAAFVVASTQQEVEEQYKLYDNYQPRRMVVIPPGVDLSRFHALHRYDPDPPYQAELNRFLQNPRKPIILTLSRPDERKNIATLVKAYAENPKLREMANLVIIAGNRDDIDSMEKGVRRVLTRLLLQIDYYDLYGRVAYPKHHDSNDVPALYQTAAKRRGVFVNPALTEPFGLTLIEAAASGLPVVATEDGGPRDIIGRCKNGVLIDPLDAEQMGQVLLRVLSNRRLWKRWARNGLRGAHHHFTWSSHVQKYLKTLRKFIEKRPKMPVATRVKSRLPTVDRFLVCDLESALIGDAEALRELLQRLRESGGKIGFGIATSRPLASVEKTVKEWEVPIPDFLITAAGSEIYYGPSLMKDKDWQRHIDYRWFPKDLKAAMRELPGASLQPRDQQHAYKISYYLDAAKAPDIRGLVRYLRKRDLHVNAVCSHRQWIDLLPIRASKGQALRYLAIRWGLSLEHLLVVGGSGGDEEMLSGNTLGVVVGNHSPELEHLRGMPYIYLAEGHHARGVIEGMEHYDFLGEFQDMKARMST